VDTKVSPGIQKALGVTVGSSFIGAIYRPAAKGCRNREGPMLQQPMA
jgi:hypothetical protein